MALTTPATRRGRRPRDAEATRGKILEAATAVFAEQGHAGARVDEIARRAGVNKALLYAYYGDKEALYRAVLTSRLAAPLSSFTQAAGADPAQALRELIRRYFRLFVDDRAFARLLGWNLLYAGRGGREALVEAGRPFLDLLQDLVLRARASGALRADVDPELFRTVVVALATGYALQHPVMDLARAQSATQRSDEDFFDYACRLLVDGGREDAGPARRRRSR